MKKYWMQVQAPAGNWVDNMGSDNIKLLIEQAVWHEEQHHENVRVVERTDTPVWQP